MDGVQGLVVVGRFRGVGQRTYGSKHPTKAGQDVPGMFELRVGVERRDGSEFVHSLSFFREDFEGEPTPIATRLERFDGGEGDRVAVAVKAVTSSGSQYVNLEPLSITLLPSPSTGNLSAVS